MRIRNFLPLLYIHVELPLVSIHTAIMTDHFDMLEREYVVLSVKIWKWYFAFRLYDTYRRIHRREIENKEKE